MDHYIYPSELALLLVWLTAPAEVAMLVILWFLGTIRGAFARPFRPRFVLVLIVAYASALVLAVPIWLLLPHALLPASVLPDKWPSLPPLAFAPAWIACSAAGLAAWVIMWMSLPNPPLEPTERFGDV